MSDQPPDPAPDPTTEPWVGPWVELRIHGVSGTPPETMLESAHVVQVAGNAWGRFFRPADAVGREVQDAPGRTLEGYHWGKYTSGSTLKGLWLLLIPFGLVNAAAFMVPDPGPDRRNKQLHALALGLIRAVGVGLTCTFALAAGLILVDLVGYSWASGVPWLRALGVRWTLATGLVLAGAVMFVLHKLGDENRFAEFDDAPPSSLAADSSGAGMRRTSFFTETIRAPVLGRLHLATGYSVVALIGALTWQSIADDTPGTRGSGLQAAVWAVSLLLLAVTSTLVTWLGDPEQAISGTTDYAWHVVLPNLSRWLVIVSGIAVLVSAGLLATTRPRQLTLDLDSYARFLPLASTLALLPLLFICLLLGRRTVGSRDSTTPPVFRAYVGGLAAWATTSTGLFVGVGFCAAFDLGVAKLVGRPAQTDLIYRIAYAWGLTVCLVTLMVLVAITWWRSRSQAELPGVSRAYRRVDTSTGLSDHLPRGWDRKVAGAAGTAQGKLHVAGPVLLLATVGTVISLITWMEMFHWNTPGVVAWLSHGRESLPSSPTAAPPVRQARAFVVLYNVGTYALIASAGMLFVLGRRALRTEQTRRGINVVWDVISFWPHSVHPFVPPSYAQFAVHDLRRRIRFHLGLPPIPRRQEDGSPSPDALADDAPAVVVSAHSQGSLIAFATMLWLSDEELRRVALVTYGSQLQVAFPRGFPAYVDVGLIARVRDALGGRWVNLYRETDPIAGPVLSWDREPLAEPPTLPSSRRVGDPEPGTDVLVGHTGRRESGDDWRVLDPLPVDASLQVTTLTHLSKHSGYPTTADYREAVARLLTRIEG
jgi:hypothetical protein